MKFKRIISVIFTVPLALILIAFILANREMMNVRFNPFDGEGTGWSFTAPAFVFLFACLGIGVVIGSVVTWIGQHKYRKQARRLTNALDS